MTGQMYSAREVADLCSVSVDAVRAAIGRGDLRATRVFNRVRISQSALDAYRRAGEIAPPARVEPRRAVPRGRAAAGSLAALDAIEREFAAEVATGRQRA